MKRKNWARYLIMGLAFLMALVMLAGLIVPYLLH
jgi:hypothetical protein